MVRPCFALQDLDSSLYQSCSLLVSPLIPPNHSEAVKGNRQRSCGLRFLFQNRPRPVQQLLRFAMLSLFDQGFGQNVARDRNLLVFRWQ